jgi:purine nucleosidase
MQDLESIAIDTSIKAEEYLAANADQCPGELEILAIGPLTNIAKAIQYSAEFKSRLKHLYLMGGAYWLDRPEHNIRCDMDAAQMVFESGMPITAIGLDLTLRVWITEKDLRQIATLPNQLGTTLENEIRTWWTFRNLDRNHPHDPLAGLAVIHPELFRFEYANVRVGNSSRDFAKTIVTNPGKGAVRIASDVLVRTAEKEIVRRIVA